MSKYTFFALQIFATNNRLNLPLHEVWLHFLIEAVAYAQRMHPRAPKTPEYITTCEVEAYAHDVISTAALAHLYSPQRQHSLSVRKFITRYAKTHDVLPF